MSDLVTSPVTPFFFAPRELMAIADAKREAFATATPFPHIVLDQFLPDDVLEHVLSEFPEPNDERWFRFDHTKSHKSGMHEDWKFGPGTRQLMSQFNSAVFVKFLERITGIEGLIPDPHFEGGGLHQIEPGGFLKVHVDFNFHSGWQLERRVNVLVYLNHDWDEAWGGLLDLWDLDMTQHRAIAPVFNRMVIFATNDKSKHGHPDPLSCPDGVVRRSLALYYYSNGRPDAEQSDPHLTTHFARPGEVLHESSPPKGRNKSLVREFIPPILIPAAARLHSRLNSLKARLP